MNDWIDVGPRAEFENEVGKRFDSGDHRVAVFVIGDEAYAIGDKCSHAEASLADGEVFDGEVECPRHGSAFDLSTGVPGALPATVPVPVYDTQITDGVIQIRLRSTS